jgi:tetratricopeptide (TPR) repeat protein
MLESAYERTSDYSFRQRAGQIKIKQLRRKLRLAKAAVEINPEDEQARSEAEQLAVEFEQAELEHFRLSVENYPTDLAAKYEYAVRLFGKGDYDEAIPLLQQAQRGPKLKIAAMDKIGMCFFHKGWMADAVDIFTDAVKSYEIKDDAVGRELRYNLARCYEEMGDTEKALDIYRRIAQQDFTYKDVSSRVDRLRNSKN